MPACLRDLLHGVDVLDSRGPLDSEIASLAYDSRQVIPGALFFALPGLHTDGRAFIAQALSAGARAIVHEGELETYQEGIAYLRVASSRRAMSPIASAFHGHPSRALGVIGVTGTEGKSTTVYLIWQLLGLLGKGVGFFSTVNSDTGEGEKPNPEHQTTPEAPAVQRMLAQMVDAGYAYAVVESSSHGLSPRLNRLGDVAFDVGVFMNVTHEHLEFHGSWEQYREDKANLFRALDTHGHLKALASGQAELPSFGVACADDPSAPYFAQATGKKVLTFSTKGRKADYQAQDIRSDEAGASFVIEAEGRRLPARIELPGAFNVDNALAALIAVSGILGLDWAGLVPLLPRLRPVLGRMTRVSAGQPFEVIVDYAHTPSSFLAVFPPLRARAPGRMLCVFGSGGERDVEKRPQQGRIAADYFDVIILSDEDPRGEDPRALLEMIAAGCPEKRRGEELFVIPDRPTAIRKAFELARPGDIVMLLGKGHENSIIYRNETRPYDEIGCALSVLASLGYKEKA